MPLQPDAALGIVLLQLGQQLGELRLAQLRLQRRLVERLGRGEQQRLQHLLGVRARSWRAAGP